MKKVAGYVLVALNALIILFFIFRDQLSFTSWMQSFGRVHPLFLHIPIGILLLAITIVFFARRLASEDLVDFLIAFFALTAALTALMGIVLGAEKGYESDVLNTHRISGMLVSLVAWATYSVRRMTPERVLLSKGLLAASTILLLIAGHFGSVMTHGNQFVLSPVLGDDSQSQSISDSTSMFRAAVWPILEEKCAGCHNDNKRKGKLSMESAAALLKGGEHGVLWHRGEPGKSLLITRILLPETHKEHMPPDGKPQLTLTEVNLLYQWIQSGADTTVAWIAYGKQDTVRKLAERLMSITKKKSGPKYSFDAADESTIKQLNDPYRSVAPVALGEPGLAASFYIREQYSSQRLDDLRKIKDQVVELNLDGMPVTDSDCETISQFDNLEKLNLNFSSITGKCLSSLSTLDKLTSLAVAGTSLDENSLNELRNFPALKNAYIWNTAVSDFQSLSKQLSGITLETGAQINDHETLRLSPPMLTEELDIASEDDSVAFTHKLPGVLIRYTIDGSNPDSTTSTVYSKPFPIAAVTEVKAIACKPGWYCSKSARFFLFEKSYTTDAALNTQPSKDYRGQGAKTIIDNKKGFADNYRGDGAWLGYREQPFDATFTLITSPPVNEIVISYARNTPSFLFPPSSVEIWAGDDKKKMKVIREVKPVQPTEHGTTQIEALRIPLDNAHYPFYRIVAKPIPQLPAWHPAAKNKDTKDKRGWLFVDEVFFN